MISKRLKSLVKYFNTSDNVIDIGCDHALLDIYLVKNNYLSSIMVSDVHENALNCGKENICKEGLEEKIFTKLGDGLNVLDNSDLVDTIIISGMGTKTILEILNHDRINDINKLIIQSNRDYDILRKNIVNMGFYIDQEEVIEDNNKVYINICFLRGKKKYTNNELKYGTNNMKNKSLYYKYLINKKEIILKNITNENMKKILFDEVEFLKKLL